MAIKIPLTKYIAVFTVCVLTSLSSQDWPGWRGIYQNGGSNETGLISEWSQDGKNLVWRVDFTGRATPVVMNGKVYVMGRVGEGVSMQEQAACFDAKDGRLLWQHRYNVRNSYAPFSRIGWASMAADPETGNVYSIGTGGMLHCFDENGKILWYRSLIEEFAVRTGYGGRTTTPVIDEDRVIVGFVSAGWGDQKPMKHRHFAFDKRTGAVIWMATPGGIFKAPNIYSNPVVAVIEGRRLFIAGNADGNVYAMKARTGEKVWEFHLSKRGLNSSVAVDGHRVYAAHSEENIDTSTMGRIVCIDGRGSGDITKTHELWRYDAEAGYTSPLVHNGKVYYIDNAANLICLDAVSGEFYWEYSLGTVGKGSPVWADGKIYVTETNGAFHILQPRERECLSLDVEKISMPHGRAAEIYASPAVAYRRIYFVTEEGLYCLGDKNGGFKVSKPVVHQLAGESTPPSNAGAAYLQVVPAEVVAVPGQTIQFTARAFDDRGRFLREVEAGWSLSPGLLKGTPRSRIEKGAFTIPGKSGFRAGIVSAKLGELEGSARVRVFPELPWFEDFESYEENENPAWWPGAGSARSPGGKFIVKQINGNKVMAKPTAERGIQRHVTFIGTSKMRDYVIEADVMDRRYKRKRGDAGLVSHGYTLDLMGKTQRLEIRSWTSENRIREAVDYSWEPETWHTIKMAVEFADGKAVIKGKVWKTSQPEPNEWTITAEDPYPVREGSPGLYGVSYSEVYFDNVRVTGGEEE